MKPNKTINVGMLLLMNLLLIYVMTLNFNGINTLIIDKLFSFIFPTFIFFLFWSFSFKNRNEKLNISSYYLKIVLNVVLPYFMCTMFYILFKYGINNLNVDSFVRFLVTEEFSKQFILIRTIISLLIVYPIVNWLVKINMKVAIISSFILSAISNLFKFDFIYVSDIFNYLIYMVIGISFTQLKNILIPLWEKSLEKYMLYAIEIFILMFVTTYFKFLNEFSSLINILYSILIITVLSNMCYRYRGYFSLKFLDNQNIIDVILNSSSIIIILTLMLNLINISFTEILIRISKNNTIEMVQYVTILVCILIIMNIKTLILENKKVIVGNSK